LPAAWGWLTRRAIPALCKGHGHQEPGRGNITTGAPKGWTFRKRLRAQPECKNAIRDPSLKGQLHPGSKRAFNKMVRQTFGLEVMKRVVRISIRLQEVSKWTLWRSWQPPKQKKRLLAA
jgi:hypothetical protein